MGNNGKKKTKARKPSVTTPARNAVTKKKGKKRADTAAANGAVPARAKKAHQQRASAPSTPSTQFRLVEDVEDVDGQAKKPRYQYELKAGMSRNFRQLGKLLASVMPHLYQHPDGGLLLIDGNRPRRITSARELAPLLIDHVRITVTKEGKYHGERIAEATLNNMLLSRTFLDNFPKVEQVVTTAIALADFTPSQPGFNQLGGIFYLGSPIIPAQSLDAIKTFIDVMPWQSNADRTNAVAALVTVPARFHFPGGKPFVFVAASKSHAGKGTVIEFVRCGTMKAEFSYQDKDWPMQKDLHEQLLQRPEIGVISLDNVRTDSSGRARIIRTGFLESFITNAEIVLSSATSRSKPIRTANRFVVLLNTNEGSLSIDLLNRSLPIRLNPTGDLMDRIAKVKERLGGDVKHEWLPAHQTQIEAELWGMIERWVKAGKPLDQSVRHPMGPWAATIGGILQVNGFTDFLANYSATRASADPIREALGILAFHAGNRPRRAGELATLAVDQGLAKTIMTGADAANIAACERKIGITLRPFVGETFTVCTAAEKITYRLKKESKRWDDEHPHYRYTFEEIGREVVTEEPHGLVLEERVASSNHYRPNFDHIQPRTELP